MNVDKLVDFKLQLAGLPLGNQEFDYVVDTEFFARMDSSEIHSGLVNVAINVNNSQSCYTLDFTVTGDIQITCDRCLDEMTHHVDDNYRLTVKIGENAVEDADDVIVVPKDQREIDLAPFIYDTIALTIPIRHVHADGECNSDMEQRLRSLDADADVKDDDIVNNDPRWDALRDLLDNK